MSQMVLVSPPALPALVKVSGDRAGVRFGCWGSMEQIWESSDICIMRRARLCKATAPKYRCGLHFSDV
jgi:hypothetical protein